ncbi:MAG: AMP-binding protein [Candidatus Omnitrophica bacterium]|nr:AMP-binding protein [Candidatus Omnitrophota bacterium]MBL7210654.1 AMP-binding protein [Candidatus Omnitrophota bacterium]
MNLQELSIHKRFSETARRFPAKVALQVEKDTHWQKITYKELKEQALKTACLLRGIGLQPHSLAGLMLENRPEWAVIYLGMMYAGITCVPLDVQLSSEEMANLISDSSAKALFCSHEVFNKKITPQIRRLLNKIIVLDLTGAPGQDCISFNETENCACPDEGILPADPQNVASLIYTSGTTAVPKGVLLTHKNLCSNFLSISGLNIFLPSDNTLSILPLHHAYPFMVNLLVPLLSGATVTFAPAGFKPQELTKIVQEAEITLLTGVPQFFSLIYNSISEKIKRAPFFIRPFLLILIRARIKQRFASLRFMASGGARLEPALARGLAKAGFKITEGYGLTETSPVVTFNPIERVKFGSVGKPIPGVEIKINNPDRAGIGEIFIKGPNVMQGYFKHPEMTSAVIKEGWFNSEDLGYIDKDGYLFITGREKEVIVLSSGKNIYSEELEAYYSGSPYIKEICILQKSEKKSGLSNGSLHAVVVPDFEYCRSKNIANIHAKIRWELENLGRKLPVYKHIMGFTLSKLELPRTALRKLKRYKIQEEYLKRAAGGLDVKRAAPCAEEGEILNTEAARKIIRYLSTRLKRPVYLDSHLEIDLGIDSLTQVELALGIEKLFSVKIPDDFFLGVTTVKEAILKIADLRSGGTSAAKSTFENWGQILRNPPRTEIIRKIRLEPRLFDYLLTGIFKSLFLFIFRLLWFLRIKGKTSLPSKGPYIICPNHASFLDGFVVFASLPLKLALNTYFIGHNYIFEYPLVKWAIKLARLISINPNTHLVDAMQAAAYLVSQGKIVCIFPEGERSINGELAEFKKGIGILLKELGIPAVPVYIKGSYQSWPRGVLAPKLYPLKIIFGRPVSAQELIKHGKTSTPDSYGLIASGLKEELEIISKTDNIVEA